MFHKTRLVRPVALLPLFLATATVALPPIPSMAQTRKAPAPTSALLEARLRKAQAIYNEAVRARNGGPVFNIYGKIESGTAKKLLIYGQSTPNNNAAEKGIGTNTDDSFLTIYNADPNSMNSGHYQAFCVALSQTEFTPVPPQYSQLGEIANKYAGIIRSIENEIAAKRRAGVEADRREEAARLAKIEKGKQAQRDSVHRARLALAGTETKALLKKLDTGLSTVSDKGSGYLQSSAMSVALYNKWGNLGVNQAALVERAYTDLLKAATWQLERDDWTSASKTVEKLLSLELFGLTPNDPKSGKERTEMGPDQMPTSAVTYVLRDKEVEPSAVTALANVWLQKLPPYLSGAAEQGDKIRAANLSQLLGAFVFHASVARTQVIAASLDTVRGAYGPGALKVVTQFAPAVEKAKAVRVAKQVASFEALAKPETTGNVNPPVPPQIPEKVATPTIEIPHVPAPDFTFRSFKTGRKVNLSDFRGKTVVLYFWMIDGERLDVSPSPSERLFAISKRYDPSKVALLLVSEYELSSFLIDILKRATDPTGEHSPKRGQALRIYPDEIYAVENGHPDRAGEVTPEAVETKAALTFYTGSAKVSWNAMRVTVINAKGLVVGSTDFEEDLNGAAFNSHNNPTLNNSVYDFNEEKLEDLLAASLASDEK